MSLQIIKGKSDGPIIGVMALTHGDETAGLAAHTFLRQYFATTPLTHGEIWLIRGNIQAYQQGTRCVAHDMNRLFLSDDDPALHGVDWRSSDFQRSRELMPVLARCDYLLDLHNTTRPSQPFSLCMSESPAHLRLASGLPVALCAYGFQKFVAGTTCRWVDRHGGVAVAVECGYQHDPQSHAIAIACCKSLLGHLDVTDFSNDRAGVRQHVQIFAREYIADKETFDYVREYHNFDAVMPGELIAIDSKRAYRAPHTTNMVIVFPVSMKSVREGSNREAFFLGEFLTAEQHPVSQG